MHGETFTFIILDNFNHVREILIAMQKKLTPAGALYIQPKVHILKYCEELYNWRNCPLILFYFKKSLHAKI
jgi:hypothetical protein